MLGTHTHRQHSYSVHMTREELSELLEEITDTVLFDPEGLPLLAALRTKLTKLESSKEGTRA